MSNILKYFGGILGLFLGLFFGASGVALGQTPTISVQPACESARLHAGVCYTNTTGNIEWQVEYSAATTLTTGDITLTNHAGTAITSPPTISVTPASGSNTRYTIATTGGNLAEVEYSIRINTITNPAATLYDNARYIVDRTRPTVVSFGSTRTSEPRKFNWFIEFNELVTGFRGFRTDANRGPSVLHTANAASGNLTSIRFTNQSPRRDSGVRTRRYTFDVEWLGSFEGRARLNLNGPDGRVRDIAGNEAANTNSQTTDVVDTTAPTLAVTGRSGDGTDIAWEVTFSDRNPTFTSIGAEDFVIQNGEGNDVSATINVNPNGNTDHHTNNDVINGTVIVTATGITGEHRGLRLALADNHSIVDIANQKVQSLTGAANFIYDIGFLNLTSLGVEPTCPTARLHDGICYTNKSGDIQWEAFFSQPVTLTDSNITLTDNDGTALSPQPTISVTPTSGRNHRYTISTSVQDGEYSIRLGNFASITNEQNTALTAIASDSTIYNSARYVVDRTKPTVVLSSTRTDNPRRFNWSAQFNDTVTGLDANDFDVVGGTTRSNTGFLNLRRSQNATGTIYNFQILWNSFEGRARLVLLADRVRDLAGNATIRTDAQTTDVIDVTAPTLAVTGRSGGPADIAWELTFTDANPKYSSITTNDFELRDSNNELVPATINVNPNGNVDVDNNRERQDTQNNKMVIVTATGITGGHSGVRLALVDDNDVQDSFGRKLAFDSNTQSERLAAAADFTYDIVPPSPPRLVSITGNVNGRTIAWRVTFNESVINVGINDFRVTDTSLTTTINNDLSGSGATYTFSTTTDGIEGGTVSIELSPTSTINDEEASTAMENRQPTGTIQTITLPTIDPSLTTINVQPACPAARVHDGICYTNTTGNIEWQVANPVDVLTNNNVTLTNHAGTAITATPISVEQVSSSSNLTIYKIATTASGALPEGEYSIRLTSITDATKYNNARYIVDRTAPQVVAGSLRSTRTSNLRAFDWQVQFTEIVERFNRNNIFARNGNFFALSAVNVDSNDRTLYNFRITWLSTDSTRATDFEGIESVRIDQRSFAPIDRAGNELALPVFTEHVDIVDTIAPILDVTNRATGEAFEIAWQLTVTDANPKYSSITANGFELRDSNNELVPATINVNRNGNVDVADNREQDTSNNKTIIVTASAISGEHSGVRLALASGHNVQDSFGTKASLTDAAGFTYDITPPTLTSLNVQPACEAARLHEGICYTNTSGDIKWQAEFSTPVTLAANNISLTDHDGNAVSTPPTISVSPTSLRNQTYTITLNSSTLAEGNYALRLTNTGTITDGGNNPLAAPATDAAVYNSGRYIIDRTPPEVVEPTPGVVTFGSTRTSDPRKFNWTIQFNELVTGFRAANEGSNRSINSVASAATGGKPNPIQFTSQTPGADERTTQYTFVAEWGGTFEGRARVNLTGAGRVRDIAGNESADTNSQTTDVVDTTAPTIAVTALAGGEFDIAWEVTFTDRNPTFTSITGDDFVLQDAAGVAVQAENISVDPNGNTDQHTNNNVINGTIIVTATGFTSNHTGVRLLLASGHNIADIAGNKPASLTGGDGFTYSVSPPSPPRLVSISGDANGRIITWTVTFDEPVTDVDINDFRVKAGSLAGTIINDDITGTGTTRTFTTTTPGREVGDVTIELAATPTINDEPGTAMVNFEPTGTIADVTLQAGGTPPVVRVAGVSDANGVVDTSATAIYTNAQDLYWRIAITDDGDIDHSSVSVEDFVIVSDTPQATYTGHTLTRITGTDDYVIGLANVPNNRTFYYPRARSTMQIADTAGNVQTAMASVSQNERQEYSYRVRRGGVRIEFFQRLESSIDGQTGVATVNWRMAFNALMGPTFSPEDFIVTDNRGGDNRLRDATTINNDFRPECPPNAPCDVSRTWAFTTTTQHFQPGQGVRLNQIGGSFTMELSENTTIEDAFGNILTNRSLTAPTFNARATYQHPSINALSFQAYDDIDGGGNRVSGGLSPDDPVASNAKSVVISITYDGVPPPPPAFNNEQYNIQIIDLEEGSRLDLPQWRINYSEQTHQIILNIEGLTTRIGTTPAKLTINNGAPDFEFLGRIESSSRPESERDFYIDFRGPILTRVQSERVTGREAQWAVTFNEAVKNVTASDFTFRSLSSDPPGFDLGAITTITTPPRSRSGNALDRIWLFTSTTGGTNGGELTVGLSPTAQITDDVGNTISNTTIGTIEISNIIEANRPTVRSITPISTVEEATITGLVRWRVMFNEPVEMVTAENFTASTGNTILEVFAIDSLAGFSNLWEVNTRTRETGGVTIELAENQTSPGDNSEGGRDRNQNYIMANPTPITGSITKGPSPANQTFSVEQTVLKVTPTNLVFTIDFSLEVALSNIPNLEAVDSSDFQLLTGEGLVTNTNPIVGTPTQLRPANLSLSRNRRQIVITAPHGRQGRNNRPFAIELRLTENGKKIKSITNQATITNPSPDDRLLISFNPDFLARAPAPAVRVRVRNDAIPIEPTVSASYVTTPAYTNNSSSNPAGELREIVYTIVSSNSGRNVDPNQQSTATVNRVEVTRTGSGFNNESDANRLHPNAHYAVEAECRLGPCHLVLDEPSVDISDPNDDVIRIPIREIGGDIVFRLRPGRGRITARRLTRQSTLTRSFFFRKAPIVPNIRLLPNSINNLNFEIEVDFGVGVGKPPASSQNRTIFTQALDASDFKFEPEDAVRNFVVDSSDSVNGRYIIRAEHRLSPLDEEDLRFNFVVDSFDRNNQNDPVVRIASNEIRAVSANYYRIIEESSGRNEDVTRSFILPVNSLTVPAVESFEIDTTDGHRNPLPPNVFTIAQIYFIVTFNVPIKGLAFDDFDLEIHPNARIIGRESQFIGVAPINADRNGFATQWRVFTRAQIGRGPAGEAVTVRFTDGTSIDPIGVMAPPNFNLGSPIPEITFNFNFRPPDADPPIIESVVRNSNGGGQRTIAGTGAEGAPDEPARWLVTFNENVLGVDFNEQSSPQFSVRDENNIPIPNSKTVVRRPDGYSGTRGASEYEVLFSTTHTSSEDIPLHLHLISTAGIEDTSSTGGAQGTGPNSFAMATGDISGSQNFIFNSDREKPTVQSVVRHNEAAERVPAAIGVDSTLAFLVTFSENVTSVGQEDFALRITNVADSTEITVPNVTSSIERVENSNTQYIVTYTLSAVDFQTGSFTNDVRIELVASGILEIIDDNGNANRLDFTQGELLTATQESYIYNGDIINPVITEMAIRVHKTNAATTALSSDFYTRNDGADGGEVARYAYPGFYIRYRLTFNKPLANITSQANADADTIGGGAISNQFVVSSSELTAVSEITVSKVSDTIYYVDVRLPSREVALATFGEFEPSEKQLNYVCASGITDASPNANEFVPSSNSSCGNEGVDFVQLTSSGTTPTFNFDGLPREFEKFEVITQPSVREVKFRATFVSPVTGLEKTDFTLESSDTSATIATLDSVGSSNRIYDITTSAIATGAGSYVTITLNNKDIDPRGPHTDLILPDPPPSLRYEFTDSVAPRISEITALPETAGESQPRTPASSASPARWRITFNEPVAITDLTTQTNFGVVNSSGTAISGTTTIMQPANYDATAGATTYEIQFTTSDNNIVVDTNIFLSLLATAGINDVSTTGGTDGSSANALQAELGIIDRNQFLILNVDAVAPRIVSINGTINANNVRVVDWVVTFNEPVKNFTAAHLTLSDDTTPAGDLVALIDISEFTPEAAVNGFSEVWNFSTTASGELEGMLTIVVAADSSATNPQQIIDRAMNELTDFNLQNQGNNVNTRQISPPSPTIMSTELASMPVAENNSQQNPAETLVSLTYTITFSSDSRTADRGVNFELMGDFVSSNAGLADSDAHYTLRAVCLSAPCHVDFGIPSIDISNTLIDVVTIPFNSVAGNIRFKLAVGPSSTFTSTTGNLHDGFYHAPQFFTPTIEHVATDESIVHLRVNFGRAVGKPKDATTFYSSAFTANSLEELEAADFSFVPSASFGTITVNNFDGETGAAGIYNVRVAHTITSASPADINFRLVIDSTGENNLARIIASETTPTTSEYLSRVDASSDVRSEQFTLDRIDTIVPQIVDFSLDTSVGNLNPTGRQTSGRVFFILTFNTAVRGLSPSNFRVTTNGDATISNENIGASPVNDFDADGYATQWRVGTAGVVSRGTNGEGATLSMVNTNGIDPIGSRTTVPLSGQSAVTFSFASDVIPLDSQPPTIERLTINQSTIVRAAGNVSWDIVFSENVTGVLPEHFAISNTDIVGSVISAVASVDETIYTITANITDAPDVDTDFTLRLTSAASAIVDRSDTPNALVVPQDRVIAGAEIYTASFDKAAPTIINLTLNGNERITSPGNVAWTLTFNKPVTNVLASHFAITGGITGTISSVTGTGATRIITANITAAPNVDTSFTLRLTQEARGIVDTENPPNNFVVPSDNEIPNAQTYTANFDSESPTILFFERLDDEVLTSAGDVRWQLIFSENVTGVATNHFEVVGNGVAGTITSVTVSPSDGANYTITANITAATVTNATFTLRFTQAASGAIRDTTAQANAFVVPTGGTIPNADSYTANFDSSIPSIISLIRLGNTNIIRTAGDVSWQITFSESVVGVASNQFAISDGRVTGTITLQEVSGTTYTITANITAAPTVDTNFTLQLTSQASAIRDTSSPANNFVIPTNNQIPNAQSFTANFDSTPPTVTITRANNAAEVVPFAFGVRPQIHWLLTFSEPVQNVNIADFVIVGRVGNTGNFSPLPSVTLNSLSGNGPYTIRATMPSSGLDEGYEIALARSSSFDIIDSNQNAFASTTANQVFAGSQNYRYQTDGDAVAPDIDAPTLANISALIAGKGNVSNNSGNAIDRYARRGDVITYTLTFNEPVQGVTASDFSLSDSALNSASTITASGSANVHTITVRLPNSSVGDSDNAPIDFNLMHSGTSIVDDSGNVFAAGLGTPITFTFDSTSPTFSQFIVTSGAADVVMFTARFNTPVSGVSKSNFRLTSSDSNADFTVSPSGASAESEYTIRTTAIAPQPSPRFATIEITNITGITPRGPEPFRLNGNTSLRHSFIDNISPTITSLTRANNSPQIISAAGRIVWQLQFSESVVGVSVNNFALEGIGGDIVQVEGSGSTYTITAQVTETPAEQTTIGLRIVAGGIMDLSNTGGSDGSSANRLNQNGSLANLNLNQYETYTLSSAQLAADNPITKEISASFETNPNHVVPPLLNGETAEQPAGRVVYIEWVVRYSRAVPTPLNNSYSLICVNGGVACRGNQLPMLTVSSNQAGDVHTVRAIRGARGQRLAAIDGTLTLTGGFAPLPSDTNTIVYIDNVPPNVVSLDLTDPQPQGRLEWIVETSEPVTGLSQNNLSFTPLLPGVLAAITQVQGEPNNWRISIPEQETSVSLRVIEARVTDESTSIDGAIDIAGNSLIESRGSSASTPNFVADFMERQATKIVSAVPNLANRSVRLRDGDNLKRVAQAQSFTMDMDNELVRVNYTGNFIFGLPTIFDIGLDKEPELWAEVSYGSSKHTNGTKASAVFASMGADVEINEKLVLGVLTQLDFADERSPLDNTMVVNLESTGWLLGPYVVYELGGEGLLSDVVFEGKIAYGQSKYEVNQGGNVTDKFDTKRVLSAISFTKQDFNNFDGWSLNPQLSYIYYNESYGNYANSSGNIITGRDVDFNRFEFGPVFTRVFYQPDGSSYTPSVTFLLVVDSSDGQNSNDEDFTSKLGAEIVFTGTSGIDWYIGGYYEGIGNDLETYGFSAGIAINY